MRRNMLFFFDAILAQFVKQLKATLVYEILFVGGYGSKRTNYITLVLDNFRSIMLRSLNSRRFLQRSIFLRLNREKANAHYVRQFVK